MKDYYKKYLKYKKKYLVTKKIFGGSGPGEADPSKINSGVSRTRGTRRSESRPSTPYSVPSRNYGNVTPSGFVPQGPLAPTFPPCRAKAM